MCAMLGHENSKKSVPWIESHPEIYKNTTYITLSDCNIKPQNLWPCCTMKDTLCFTTAIFSQRMTHCQFPHITNKTSTKAVIYELYRPSKPLD